MRLMAERAPQRLFGPLSLRESMRTYKGTSSRGFSHLFFMEASRENLWARRAAPISRAAITCLILSQGSVTQPVTDWMRSPVGGRRGARTLAVYFRRSRAAIVRVIDEPPPTFRPAGVSV